ncbi:MAG TPA: hypothetical protein VGS19_15020 [Streptosporangiaceae bacterium]|nr:hypothetical protein [Streptosporangiaceae bacterium]
MTEVVEAGSAEQYAACVWQAVSAPGHGPLPVLRPVGSRLPPLTTATAPNAGLAGPAGPADPAGPAGPAGPADPAGLAGLAGPADPAGLAGLAGLAGRWPGLAARGAAGVLAWYTAAMLSRSQWAGPESGQVTALVSEVLAMAPQHRAPALAAQAGAGQPGAVLGYGDPAWGLAAMLHASRTDRPLCWFDSAGDLVAAVAEAGPGPLTVCAPAGLLTAGVLDSLALATSFTAASAGLGDVRFPARPVSLLTARTLEVASRVVAVHQPRPLPASQDGTAWVSTERLPGRVTDPGTALVTEKEADAGRVTQLAGRALLMLWGHSREDLFHLGDDALCGASHEAALAGPSQRLPACALDGQCIKRGQIVPIHRVTGEVLVIGGCNIIRLGGSGTFAPEFSLALSAFEGGAGAVVSSPWTRIGAPVELLFLYRLLRTGTDLGEAVRLLNSAIPFCGPDVPDYLVLGEGARPVFTAERNAATSAVTPQDGHWRAEFRGVDAEYVVVRLPELPAAPYARVCDGGEDRGLHAAFVPEPDGGCLVYLFGWQRLHTDEMTVLIGGAAPGGEAPAAIASALANYQAYGRLLRGYQPKIKNQEQELTALGTYLARRGTQARHRLAAYRECDQKAQDAAKLIADMDRSVCEYMLGRTWQRAFSWHDQYLSEDGTFVVGHRWTAAEQCPYCAGRVMVRCVVSTLAPHAQRELGICEECGTVWDRPAGGVTPVLSGEPAVRRQEAAHWAVRLRNPGSRTAHGWLGVRVRQGERHGSQTDPPLVKLALGPGEEAEVGFTTVIGAATPAHMELLRGFWVSELGVSVGQRVVWVRP